MVEKVDFVFNDGGKWVLTPQAVYIKKLNHVWQGYDVDVFSYIDICSKYTENFGFRKVKQLLVTGPSGRYYLVEFRHLNTTILIV